MATDNLKKLLDRVQRETRRSDASFILQFGTKRTFPKAFFDVDITNYPLLKEMYKITYEASLNSYMKAHFPALKDRSVVNFVRLFDSILEFIFGNDEHRGVYPIVLRNILNKYSTDADVSDVIPAVEHMFTEGYRVKNLDGTYYLVNPNLAPEIEVEKQYAKVDVESYNYISNVRELLGITNINNISDIQKIALTSFEVPSEEEKKIFDIPYNYNNSLVKLSELCEEHDYKLVNAKMSDTHSSAYLISDDYQSINLSFIGSQSRNYFWILTDYAEYRMVGDLTDKKGFIFIKNLPAAYVVDQDSYIVSKFFSVSSSPVFSMFNYVPTQLSIAYSWMDSLSTESRIQLLRELSTYTLLQLALGNDVIDESTFRVNESTRSVYNFHHSKDSLINTYSYQSLPNNMVTVTLSKNMNMMLEYEELRRIANDVDRSKQLPPESSKFFGVRSGFNIKEDMELVADMEKISCASIPEKIFKLEESIFLEWGRKILSREAGIYDNWFADHLKTSGIPEYSELYLILCNRFALFALITAMEQGVV